MIIENYIEFSISHQALTNNTVGVSMINTYQFIISLSFNFISKGGCDEKF